MKDVMSRVIGYVADFVFVVLAGLLVLLLTFNSVINIMYSPLPFGSMAVFATLALLFVGGLIRFIVRVDRN